MGICARNSSISVPPTNFRYWQEAAANLPGLKSCNMHGMSTLGSSEFEEYALMSSFKITRGGANPCLARGVFVAYQCFHGQEALTTQEPLLISGFLAIWRTTSFMRAASWNHRFIQCVFHCWINKIIKQLHTMNT